MINLFNSVLLKFSHWEQKREDSFRLVGLSPEQVALFALTAKESANFPSRQISFVCPDEETCEHILDIITSLGLNCLNFPGLDSSPFSSAVASDSDLAERFQTLSILSSGKSEDFLVTTYDALCLKSPSISFFSEQIFTLRVDDIIAPQELAKKLFQLGYFSAASVEEPGSFCQKGGVFDLYSTLGKAYRIHYFDDLIETIHQIDPETKMSLKGHEIKEISIYPSVGIFRFSQYSQTLRENIPMPSVAQKNRFDYRKQIFESLSEEELFENFALFTPLFLKESATLHDYFVKNNSIVIFVEGPQILSQFDTMFSSLEIECKKTNEDNQSFCLIQDMNQIYDFNFFRDFEQKNVCLSSRLNFAEFSNENLTNKVEIRTISAKSYLQNKIGPTIDKHDYIKKSLEAIAASFAYSGRILIAHYTDNSIKELNYLFELLGFSESLKKRITHLKCKLVDGFYYENEEVLVLTDADLFSAKKVKAQKTSSKDIDLFAEQLATLKVGDYVVHRDYGIGQYQGLETLSIGGAPSDFLVILYHGNDKVYLPVYKMNLIQKHADAVSQLKPDSLRTTKFQQLKNRARVSAKELAFDLVRLQAERQLSKAFAFSSPDHLYKEFELSFPYEETPDQLDAIEDVLSSMQKPQPMDHLVCGDVGFGKTEVAIRAAFKAVEDKKQVAVLVPTTILCLQHFNTFSKRLNDFPVKIEFLSRFNSAKESKDILQKLESGDVDIVIGTHKLLSDNIRFKDLGLVIVDEEQRFGVAHKEKLKLLKKSVDFLTLTATPIPRTLQLAFLGLKELSLIKTAPPKRQSIKTYVIRHDDFTLQQAIKKELQRGGQVFIVHNKVHDIEDFTGYIRELVPEAKIVFAHGQLPEAELEKRIQAFYNGEYQILVSTTIVESGLDIPNANTIIIDRADTYGLSQLHQLRGRIGRSDKKAYAYFVIPYAREVSSIAQKRLHALQTYAEMGSGFNIASVDLEIRGAGDILGASQSGHIEAIGLELYMELLKEAIHEIKGEKRLVKRDFEIQTPFAAYIPNDYIQDSPERLRQYKRLANCSNLDKLKSFENEFVDIFGPIGEPLRNLFLVLETKIILQELALKSLSIVGSNLTFSFDKALLENEVALRDKIVQHFISRPKIYQMTPDFKVIYQHKQAISLSDLVEISKNIAQQILPC